MMAQVDSNVAKRLLSDILLLFTTDLRPKSPEFPETSPWLPLLQMEAERLNSGFQNGKLRIEQDSQEYLKILKELIVLLEKFVKKRILTGSRAIAVHFQDRTFKRLPALQGSIKIKQSEGKPLQELQVFLNFRKLQGDHVKLLESHNDSLWGQDYQNDRSSVLEEIIDSEDEVENSQFFDSVAFFNASKSIGYQSVSPSLDTIIKLLGKQSARGSRREAFIILTLKERRVLALLLARCILQFCEGAWLYGCWGKKNIILCQDANGDRILLSTQLTPESDSSNPLHRYPGLISLGIILLELELSKSMESAREEEEIKSQEECRSTRYELEEQSMDDDQPNANTDWLTAIKLLRAKDLRENTMPGYMAAIEACLTFRTETANCSTEYIQREMYQKIVRRMERELCVMFPSVQLEGLPRIPLLRLDSITKFISPIQRSQGPIAASQKQVQVEKVQAILFDEQAITLSQDDILESDKWMKRYEAFRDDLMDKVENPDKEVGARVKIAILDTGIDWEHPYIKGAEDQIKKSRNFVGDRPGQDGKEQVKDDAGHGTHTAALLLKTVPGADIYIARVTAKTGDSIDPTKVADAIDVAVDTVNGWGVDMITMSFGFRTRIAVLQASIEAAFAKRVIIFAATSNGGANENEAYPASESDMVLGINSSTAWGVWSKFSPQPVKRSENFFTLGEGVQSSWPTHLNQGLNQRKSGTSFATPIAAGMAATMLYYARMTITDQEQLKELRSCGRMRILMKSMSQTQNVICSYLRPWKLWEEEEKDLKKHIRKILKKLTAE